MAYLNANERRFVSQNTAQAQQLIKNDCMRNSAFFEGRDPGFVSRLIDEATVEVFGPGQVIVKEGEHGECMYFLNQGHAEVSVGEPPNEVKVADLKDGAMFGEMALIGQGHKRTSTVTAKEFSDCRVLHFKPFMGVLRRFPKEQEYYKTLIKERMAKLQEVGSDAEPEPAHPRRHSHGSADLEVNLRKTGNSDHQSGFSGHRRRSLPMAPSHKNNDPHGPAADPHTHLVSFSGEEAKAKETPERRHSVHTHKSDGRRLSNGTMARRKSTTSERAEARKPQNEPQKAVAAGTYKIAPRRKSLDGSVVPDTKAPPAPGPAHRHIDPPKGSKSGKSFSGMQVPSSPSASRGNSPRHSFSVGDLPPKAAAPEAPVELSAVAKARRSLAMNVSGAHLLLMTPDDAPSASLELCEKLRQESKGHPTAVASALALERPSSKPEPSGPEQATEQPVDHQYASQGGDSHHSKTSHVHYESQGSNRDKCSSHHTAASSSSSSSFHSSASEPDAENGAAATRNCRQGIEDGPPVITSLCALAHSDSARRLASRAAFVPWSLQKKAGLPPVKAKQATVATPQLPWALGRPLGKIQGPELGEQFRELKKQALDLQSLDFPSSTPCSDSSTFSPRYSRRGRPYFSGATPRNLWVSRETMGSVSPRSHTAVELLTPVDLAGATLRDPCGIESARSQRRRSLAMRTFSGAADPEGLDHSSTSVTTNGGSWATGKPMREHILRPFTVDTADMGRNSEAFREDEQRGVWRRV